MPSDKSKKKMIECCKLSCTWHTSISATCSSHTQPNHEFTIIIFYFYNLINSIMSKNLLKALMLVCVSALFVPMTVSAQKLSRQQAKMQMVKATPAERQKAAKEWAMQNPLLAKSMSISQQKAMKAGTATKALKPVKSHFTAPKFTANAMKAAKKAPKFGEVPSLDYYYTLAYSAGGLGIGWYTSNTSNAGLINPLFECDYEASAGAGIVDGQFRYINYFSFWGYVFITAVAIDMETGEVVEGTDLGEDYYMLALETAQDQKTGTIYGVFYNEDVSGFELGIADYTNWTRTTIGEIEHFYLALGLASDGYLYGVADDNCLYKINKETAEETLVGPTGVAAADAEGSAFTQGGEIDQKTNTFVWAAIEYDSEESAIYTIDLATGAATKLADTQYGCDEMEGVLFPLVACEDDAPEAPADLAATFVDANLAGTVTFTMPAKTYAGDDLTEDSYNYSIVIDGELAALDAAAPGAAVSSDVTVETSGMHKFEVYATNNAGDGAKAKLNMWVGFDQPKAATNVVLVGNNETGEMSLTWDAPAAGIHGGFLGNLKYNVYRIAGGDPELVAEGIEETSFSEILAVGTPVNYTYGVEAVNGDVASDMALSNGTVLGKAFTVPFFEGFNSDESFALWTAIDANADGKTWKMATSGNMADYSYSASEAADDYLISPAIKFEGGKNYSITLGVGCQSTNYPERIEVLLGKGTDISTFTKVIIEPTEVVTPLASGETAETLEGSFTIEEDGEYAVAMHAISDANEWHLFVDNVSIEKGAEATAPAAVADLNVVAAAKGVLAATVNFTAPSFDIKGDALNAEDSLFNHIYRDNVEIAVVKTLPGEPVQYLDEAFESDADGVHKYTVRTANNDGLDFGAKSEAFEVYVGQDVPGDPQNVLLACTPTGITMSWEAVTEEGLNGGYVNPAEVTYSAYTVEDGYLGEEIYNGPGFSCEYQLDGFNEGEQDLFQLALSAINKVGKSGYMGYATVIGKPYTLPYAENFASEGGFDTFGYISGDGDWYLDTECADGDGQSIMWIGDAVGDAYVAFSKIALNGAQNPMFNFSYMATPGDDITLVPFVQLPNGQQVDIEPIQIKGIMGAQAIATWFNTSVSLAQFANESYIIPGIKIIVNSIGEDGYAVNFDNVLIDNMLDYNLAASVTWTDNINKGDASEVEIEVLNHGINAVEQYSVKLTNGNELIADTLVSKVLAPMESKTFKFNVQTSVFDAADVLYCTASVVYDGDLDLEDNYCDFEITFKANNLEPVSDLVAAEDGEDVVLTWNAVDGGQAQEFTESFEDAEAWSLDPNGYNGFTFVNNDNGYAGTIFNGSSVPTDGQAFAYAIWNSDDVNTSAGDFDAHSGSQFAIAIYKVDETGYLPNDSWLISPALTGEAQTIKFWVKSVSASYLDTYQVLFSITDKDINNFQALTEEEYAPNAWTEVTVDLPAGARYFAIECTSADGLAFFVDDITYTAPMSEAPMSFNIYVDQQKVGNTKEKTYTVENADKEALYSVTAVYATGESAPVTVEVTPITGINDINAAAQKNAAKFDISGRKTNATNGLMILNGKKVLVK